jgi:RNA polymerase primary sigma factor
MTEGLEKTQITGRMPHNLRTLEELRKLNIVDFTTVMAPDSSTADREAARPYFKSSAGR